MLTEPSYDRFYLRGGWNYDLLQQRRHMKTVLVPRAGWQPGDRIIEVGAGMGHHAEMLRRLGFDVTAIELSAYGVLAARKLYPELGIFHADLETFEPTAPAHVFARGASPWHYELNGVNEHGIDVPAVTARCFGWIPEGGTFVLQIVTDLSGSRRKNAESGVWNNPVEAYEQLFGRFGDVTITDWRGRPIGSGPQHTGVIVVTRR